MTDDWILDILTDLKSFAQANGMKQLADHLDDTAFVALGELACYAEKNFSGVNEQRAATGQFHRTFGIGEVTR